MWVKNKWAWIASNQVPKIPKYTKMMIISNSSFLGRRKEGQKKLPRSFKKLTNSQKNITYTLTIIWAKKPLSLPKLIATPKPHRPATSDTYPNIQGNTNIPQSIPSMPKNVPPTPKNNKSTSIAAKPKMPMKDTSTLWAIPPRTTGRKTFIAKNLLEQIPSISSE